MYFLTKHDEFTFVGHPRIAHTNLSDATFHGLRFIAEKAYESQFSWSRSHL